jgi:biotin carboxyl carrier protein
MKKSKASVKKQIKNNINLHKLVEFLYSMMKDGNLYILQINFDKYNISIKRYNNILKDYNKHIVNLKNTEHQILKCRDIKQQYEPEKKENNKKDTVKSPITGTFYKAPAPTLPPFINEGDIPQIGGVICLIEAMKVINEIKASYKMKIIKILVDNGQAVNAGQDLFEVEKLD